MVISGIAVIILQLYSFCCCKKNEINYYGLITQVVGSGFKKMPGSGLFFKGLLTSDRSCSIFNCTNQDYEILYSYMFQETILNAWMFLSDLFLLYSVCNFYLIISD